MPETPTMVLGLYQCQDCSKWHSQTENTTVESHGRWHPLSDPYYCKPRPDFVPSAEFDNYMLSLPHETTGSVVYISIYEMRRTTNTFYNRQIVSFEVSAEWVTTAPNESAIFFKGQATTGVANALSDHKRSNPDFASTAWCSANLPAGISYLGKFRAATSNRQNGEGQRNNRTVSETWHDCAHCAWVEAQAACVATPGAQAVRYPWLYQGVPMLELPRNYVGLVEVTGDNFATTATVKDVTERIANSCGNCGRVGHRSDGCEYPRKAYDRVGVEIEGRFLNKASVIRRAEDLTGGAGYCDGSVHGSSDSSAEPWEFQSKPDSIRGACQQLVDLYPDETDASCGMHVHVSFDAVDLALLNSPSFFKYFKERWEAWGAKMNLHPRSQFFQRLRGQNEYCLPAGDREYNPRNMDRYAQLNFSSFSEHNTVECRLLPMFIRASLGVAAIQELLDIYETFLQNPEAFGHPGFTRDCAFVPPTAEPVKLTTMELDVPTELVFTKQLEMELADSPPVPEGHVRVAMAVNQPITIQGLVEAMNARTAA